MTSKYRKDVTDAVHTCFAFPFRKNGWGNLTPVISHPIIECSTRCLIQSKTKVSAIKIKCTLIIKLTCVLQINRSL